jgi:hypothetical protein
MSYARRLREVLKVRCTYLCTKAMIRPLPGPDDEENPYDTAIWWCDRTGEALGPHGDTAQPGDCDGPGLECYEPPLTP